MTEDDHDPMTGPYRPVVYGKCANGHAVNSQGRCAPLNEDGPDGCPPPTDDEQEG